MSARMTGTAAMGAVFAARRVESGALDHKIICIAAASPQGARVRPLLSSPALEKNHE
jgi:hypothetical protein